MNVKVETSTFPSLHPSTCSARSINADRIESGYQFIAASINDLAWQHAVRGLHEINNNIIQTTTQKLALKYEDVNSGLISTYTQKIVDLQEECL